MPKTLHKTDTAPPAALAISTVAAAKFLGVSPKSIYRLVAIGRLKAKTWSRRTLVDVASLKAFYEALPDATGGQP